MLMKISIKIQKIKQEHKKIKQYITKKTRAYMVRNIRKISKNKIISISKKTRAYMVRQKSTAVFSNSKIIYVY